MDEIDRILASESEIEPSPDFTRRVMAEVTRDASFPPAIPFPWRRAAAAAALIAGASAAAAATPGVSGALERLIASSDLVRVDAAVLALVAAVGLASWSVIAAARAE